ncbi:hypothetical protein A7B51_02625 [Lentilactobacillus parabuchneri]|nr:hypothetical protein A7B51_02625 [Lentilactobacillus parabuchneri]OCB80757.1 hypothetical protein A7322_12400 [Lentilactobacillus parabuchneri]OCB83603.1 hypothetical protein A8O18_10325 [Lentilactobacillus parabuchneri]
MFDIPAPSVFLNIINAEPHKKMIIIIIVVTHQNLLFILDASIQVGYEISPLIKYPRSEIPKNSKKGEE